MSIDDAKAVLNAAATVSLPQGLAPKADERVTQLHGDAARLKPRSRGLLDQAIFAAEITPVLDRPYLVKGWLDRAALSVVYGPSNVGKSYLAIDIAHHVAKGLTWAGRRVNEGQVLILAAEGGAGMMNRVAALHDPRFWVLPVPMTLTGKDSAAAPLTEMILHLSATSGRKFDLIIIDTLSRIMGGGDENAAPDIADLLRNLDHIRRATGAHVMLVHHTGKDTARGARGHSSLRAAIDTEVSLTRDDDTGQITAEVTKQRDGPTGYKFQYRLRQIEIGRDQDGDPVTTCCVEPTDPAQAGRVALSDAAQAALRILDQQMTAGGETIRHPSYPGTPCVKLGDWREACLVEGAVSSAKAREDRSRAFLRVRSDLEAGRQILIRDDLVWQVQP